GGYKVRGAGGSNRELLDFCHHRVGNSTWLQPVHKRQRPAKRNTSAVISGRHCGLGHGFGGRDRRESATHTRAECKGSNRAKREELSRYRGDRLRGHLES